MKKLRFLVSLTTNDNDYQCEQAKAAQVTAHRLGVDADIVYANNDSVNQSQQLLQAIQSSPAERHDAIIFEPVGGTAFPIVARAAAEAGIGWVVLNRDVDYIAEIRKAHNVPVLPHFQSRGDWSNPGKAVCRAPAQRRLHPLY